MIEVRGVTKRFNDTVAVNDLSFEVKPGQVTGFLGPNGSGKSTTMRVIMGLDAPNSGTATINGRRFHDLPLPLREVGALLEARAIHPGAARQPSLVPRPLERHPRAPVFQVLEMVGIEKVARQAGRQVLARHGSTPRHRGRTSRRPRGPSLRRAGQRARPRRHPLGRNLLKSLAAEGRTVFVSSHLMSEMALTADHIVVIGKGKLISAGSTTEFIAENSGQFVRVRSPQIERLEELCAPRARVVRREGDGALAVSGLPGGGRSGTWPVPTASSSTSRHPVGVARGGVHGAHP